MKTMSTLVPSGWMVWLDYPLYQLILRVACTVADGAVASGYLVTSVWLLGYCAYPAAHGPAQKTITVDTLLL